MPVGLSTKDVQIESYIQSVGRKVFPIAHRKLPYQFHYLPDPNLVNAFALPGGHVFVGGGLLPRQPQGIAAPDVVVQSRRHNDRIIELDRKSWKLDADEAVRAAREGGCSDLVLLKCTSTYPATPEDTNLLTIPHMRAMCVRAKRSGGRPIRITGNDIALNIPMPRSATAKSNSAAIRSAGC